MTISCRECNVILTKENAYLSAIAYKIRLCKACDKKLAHEEYRETRIKAIKKLGHECVCCGQNKYELLSVDHIHGGGHQESKIIRGHKFNKYILNTDINILKQKYQCLCFNCNYVKGFWGCCPHTLDHYSKADTSHLPISDKGKKHNKTEEERKKRNYHLHTIRDLKCKLEMVKAYGSVCISCKEDHPLFLVLDHINNNGSLEQDSGNDFYQRLKRHGYPGNNTQLQLMCHNCNAAKKYQERRIKKTEEIKKTVEIYISQPYLISAQEEEDLWTAARQIYAQYEPYSTIRKEIRKRKN